MNSQQRYRLFLLVSKLCIVLNQMIDFGHRRCRALAGGAIDIQDFDDQCLSLDLRNPEVSFPGKAKIAFFIEIDRHWEANRGRLSTSNRQKVSRPDPVGKAE